jgi:AbrB family looped-hinge helix DNA binding protein
LTTVTSKGQITLPIELRRLIGISPGDKVRVELDDDGLRLTRVAGSVRSVFGVVQPVAKGLTVDDAIRQTREERAHYLAEHSGGRQKTQRRKRS